jgi:hypothetical protein
MPKYKPLHVELDHDVAIIALRRGSVLIDRADLNAIEGRTIFLNGAQPSLSVILYDPSSRRRLGRLSRVLTAASPGLVVDHINGNPLDNRRANLRAVTARANSLNRAKPQASSASSRFKGVTRKGASWVAYIHHDGRQIALGSFVEEDAAGRAYDAAARKLFGVSAALNFAGIGEQSALRPINTSFASHIHGGRYAD